MTTITKFEDEFHRGICKKVDEKIYIELDDDYEHVDNNIDYIIENVLMDMPTIDKSKSCERLSNLFNSYYESYCNCGDTTNSCNDSSMCKHGACYSILLKDHNERELILNKNRNGKDLLYECNSKCSCSITVCTNRLVQFGPRKHLKIIQAMNLTNQLGLSTEKFIPEGGFICEYAGEILTESEALRRNQENRNKNLKNYLICLNEYAQSSESQQCIKTYIDAGRTSNIGRYLNHSCDPNCEILSVRIDGPIPKLGMLNEFLTFT